MFKVIHDLSSLSEAERQQYCRDYATYLGLNPDENRIDTIWMNSDSIRSLVAYCRRGTTDILREIYGIDVESLVREDGPGFVSYKAMGRNRRGRVEIAVGAYATGNLVADRLAAAVATAQTRALRRLTLQFVGGGLLDESEVNSQPVQVESKPVSPPAVQPEAKPNTGTGKIVEATLNENGGVIHELVPEPDEPERIQTRPFPPSALPVVPPAFPNASEAAKSLPETSPLVLAANAIIAKDQPAEPVKPKRTKKKKTVDMGDPQPEPKPEAPAGPPANLNVPICPDCEKPMAADNRLDMFLCVQHGRVDMSVKPSTLYLPPQPVATPEPAPVPVAPPPVPKSPLSADEQKAVKTKLAKFWVSVLPEGGMTPDDGLSINGKLMKFASKFYEKAPNYKDWDFTLWEAFTGFLEDNYKKHGSAGLVDIINKVLVK